jgi:hypothetical protein
MENTARSGSSSFIFARTVATTASGSERVRTRTKGVGEPAKLQKYTVGAGGWSRPRSRASPTTPVIVAPCGS